MRIALLVLALQISPPGAFAAPRDAKAAGPDAFEPRRVTWTRLEYTAKKLFLSARSEVRLERHAAAEAAAAWIESSEGEALGLRDGDSVVLEVLIDSSVLGRRSSVAVWFDPRDGTAFQRLKERHGKKAYRKTSRFTTDGTFLLRQAPAVKSESELPFGEWTKVEKSYFPHPPEIECVVVSAPSVLFYLVSATDWSEPRRLCVFSGKRVFPVTLEAGGLERIAVDYSERRPDGETRRSGEVDVRRISIRPVAEDDQEEFELLGLEGDIEILLEESSRIPVRVEGKISGAGHVAVKLKAVELDGAGLSE